MGIDQQTVSEFMELFAGAKTEYGVHEYGTFNDGLKEEGGKNFTVREQLTFKEYEKHLNGVKGLGVVPIQRDENKSKFFVIDIDVYQPGREQQVLESIKNYDMPLNIFKSKSGGYHLYLFYKTFIPAKIAREHADKFIRLLAIDKLATNGKTAIEVFPKQSTLSKDQVGNWINLPYYDAVNCIANKRQHMIDVTGNPLELKSALMHIRMKKLYTTQDIEDYFNNLEFSDAPPCLQSMFYLNNLHEMRNNFLFSYGVYFKKKEEDSFDIAMYQFNAALPEPLSDRELENTVIKSIRKQGYGYKCKEMPCLDFCHKAECKKRTYGVCDGGLISELTFGTLRQIKMDPPYYEWEINGATIRFNNENDILKQDNFRMLCFRHIYYTPFKIKDAEWTKIVNGALAEIEIKDENSDGGMGDISEGAMLKDYFSEFVIGRPFATEKEQITMGRTWHDTVRNNFIFKPGAFIDYILTQKKLRNYSTQQLHAFLRDNGVNPERMWTGKGQTRVLVINGDRFKDDPRLLRNTTEIEQDTFSPDDILGELPF